MRRIKDVYLHFIMPKLYQSSKFKFNGCKQTKVQQRLPEEKKLHCFRKKDDRRDYLTLTLLIGILKGCLTWRVGNEHNMFHLISNDKYSWVKTTILWMVLKKKYSNVCRFMDFLGLIHQPRHHNKDILFYFPISDGWSFILIHHFLLRFPFQREKDFQS